MPRLDSSQRPAANLCTYPPAARPPACHAAPCPAPCPLPCRVFDVQKHYWGSTLIAHGFRALYMDSDAIVLQNPLEHFHPDYDVQVGS